MRYPEQILLINDFGFVNGGISRVALDSAQALADKGIDITFFSAVPGSVLEEGSRIKMKSAGQREFLADPNKLRGLGRAHWNRPVRKAVDQLAAALDPERSVVHVHSWAQANSPSIFAPLLRRKLRLVVSLHDYFIACPNGGFTDFKKVEACEVDPLSGACLMKNCDARSGLHKILKFGRQWVQNRIARTPGDIRNFIFVSPFSREILKKHLPRDSQHFLLPNPINVPKGRIADVANNRTWIYMGRLAPEKGVRLFAQAAARLKLDASFIGVGEEADAIRKIYPEAKLLGWLNRETLLEHMRRARGVVFPSICLESHPLVVSEALAMGLPIVVSSGTAATDSVLDGETGLFFKKNDVDDFVRKIRQLDESAELRTRIGRQAFERYWNDPSTLERHVDRLLEIYGAVE
jgi:glycosyltransferase involved in cell wall biosynthesis